MLPSVVRTVGRNGCGPEDYVSVRESVLAVAGLGTSLLVPIPG